MTAGRVDLAVRVPTQLYAAIRADSKYARQTAPGERFPVHVEDDPVGYVLHGGPGARYRTKDVHLYARTEAGDFIQLT